MEITGGDGTIKDTTICNSTYGGLDVKSGGDVTLVQISLTNNKPENSIYNSFRRNVLCSSSTITLSSVKEGGDGHEVTDSFWLLDDGCSLRGFENYASPFFIPTLSSALYIPKDNGDVEIVFTGSNLINCDLQYTLSYSSSSLSSSSISSSSSLSSKRSNPTVTHGLTESVSESEGRGVLSGSTDKAAVDSIRSGAAVSAGLVVKETPISASAVPVSVHPDYKEEESEDEGDGDGQGSLVCCCPWGCRIGHD